MEGQNFEPERTQSPKSIELQTGEESTSRLYRKTNNSNSTSSNFKQIGDNKPDRSRTLASEDSTVSSIFDEAWQTQNVLSLDGGGIRGYSALLVIQQLMDFIAKEELKQHKEDWIRANTSNGPFQEDKYSSYHPRDFPSEVVESKPSDNDPPEIRRQRLYSRIRIKKRRTTAFDLETTREPSYQIEMMAEDQQDPRRQRDPERQGDLQRQPTIAEMRRSKYLPCHYFDYIGGTSTGGLIAILLSRLRMPIDEALKEYETFGQRIFGHPRIFSIRGPIFFPRDKYDDDRLVEVFKEAIDKRQHKRKMYGGDLFFMSNERMCKTIAVAFEGHRVEDRTVTQTQAPYLFRSYDHHPHVPPYVQERNPGYSQRARIWQVARATTAAPTYFDPIVIDNCRYGDGGFGANNPIFEIYHEVCQMNGDKKECFNLLMSIGTGCPRRIDRYGESSIRKYFAFMKAARKLASDAEIAHENFHRTFNGQIPYHRFSVPYQENQGRTQQPAVPQKPLGDIKLDEWQPETLSSIRNATENYLSDPNVSEDLSKIAKRLVEARRARSQTMHWELYSTGAEYRCMCDDCLHVKAHKIRPHDRNLRSHLINSHGIKEGQHLEDLITRGRLEY